MNTEISASNFLLLDSASSMETIALRFKGENRMRHQFSRGPSHSLLKGVESMLAELGAQASDLDFILSGQGPGSFTAIRIVLATARMMGQLLGIPVLGISSLHLSAMLYSPPLDFFQDRGIHAILPFWDGRKGRIYASLYSPNILEILPAGDYVAKELCERIKKDQKLSLEQIIAFSPDSEWRRDKESGQDVHAEKDMNAKSRGSYKKSNSEDTLSTFGKKAKRLPELGELSYVLEPLPQRNDLFFERLISFLEANQEKLRPPADYSQAEPLYIRRADADLPKSMS